MTEEVQQVAEAETAQPEAEVKEQATESPETPAGEQEKKAEAEERKFNQKEVDEAVQKRLARESRKLERQIRAEIENKLLKEQLESKSKPAPVQQGEPKPEQFKTYEEYIRATAKWEIKQENENARIQAEQEAQKKAREAYEARVYESLSKAASKYEDFEDVVSNPAISITPVMTDAMTESEVGGEIAYYLGNNPKEAAEIAKLSPVQQVKAIDKLERKLSEGTQVKTSSAPAPIKPVSTQSAQKSFDTTDPRSVKTMSTSEWINAERDRIRRKMSGR